MRVSRQYEVDGMQGEKTSSIWFVMGYQLQVIS